MEQTNKVKEFEQSGRFVDTRILFYVTPKEKQHQIKALSLGKVKTEKKIQERGKNQTPFSFH